MGRGEGQAIPRRWSVCGQTDAQAQRHRSLGNDSEAVSATQAIGIVAVVAVVPPLPERTHAKTFFRKLRTDQPFGQLLRSLVIHLAVSAMG